MAADDSDRQTRWDPSFEHQGETLAEMEYDKTVDLQCPIQLDLMLTIPRTSWIGLKFDVNKWESECYISWSVTEKVTMARLKSFPPFLFAISIIAAQTFCHRY